MWFGLMALTISQFFSGALGYWGIEFFKRAFDLNATKAGAFAPSSEPGRCSGWSPVARWPTASCAAAT